MTGGLDARRASSHNCAVATGLQRLAFLAAAALFVWLFATGRAVAAVWLMTAPFLVLATAGAAWLGLAALMVVLVYARDQVHRAAAEPDDPASVPYVDRAALERLTAELKDAGFLPVGDMIVDRLQFGRFFVDTARTTTAGICMSPNPDARCWVNVSTSFPDRRFVTSTNRARAHILAVPAGSRVLRLPGAPVARLLVAHREAVGAAAGAERVADDAIGWLVARLRRQFEHHAEGGLFRPAGSDGFRLTWKGAFRAVRLGLSETATLPGEELRSEKKGLAPDAVAAAAFELVCALTVLLAFHRLVWAAPESRLPYQLAVLAGGAAIVASWTWTRVKRRGEGERSR